MKPGHSSVVEDVLKYELLEWADEWLKFPNILTLGQSILEMRGHQRVLSGRMHEIPAPFLDSCGYYSSGAVFHGWPRTPP